MEAVQHYTITDSRETVEAEALHNNFEVGMELVDHGIVSFNQAMEMVRSGSIPVEHLNALAAAAIQVEAA